MTPTRREVEALMKRCQIGVGGRNALDNAHSIMAECYGTLGALMLRVEELAEADVLDRLEKAENRLISEGYSRECNIPACNCGNRWAHGGRALRQLSAIADIVPHDGVSLLDAVQKLVDGQ